MPPLLSNCLVSCGSSTRASIATCSWFIWPPDGCLLPLPFSFSSWSQPEPPTGSQVQPSSPSCPVTGSSLYYPGRGCWGAFFIARWSIQCLCPDYNLILYRTQHLNTQSTRPTPTQRYLETRINLCLKSDDKAGSAGKWKHEDRWKKRGRDSEIWESKRDRQRYKRTCCAGQ